jgi:hypothetical protein
MAEERGFGKLMAWVGIAAALISFGTAVYELLHAQGELRERRRVVAEQMSSGATEQAAGYYPAAWDSFQKAADTAEADGMLAKLLGGLSKERQAVRTAQENLAMEWLRNTHLAEGQTFADLTDKLVGTLAAGLSTSTGARQADLQAHLGWAYFLRYRDGDRNVAPDVAYRKAVAADATNPYGNVFWGHWILWTQRSVPQARERFSAALATDRARADVRRFQLAGLSNVRSDEAEAEWLRTLEDMREHGEPLGDATKSDLYSRYYSALNDSEMRDRMLAAIPPDQQLELQRTLLDWADLEPYKKQTVKALRAFTLEASSNRDGALAAWKDLLAETGSEPGSTLAERARLEIKRLSGRSSKHPSP